MLEMGLSIASVAYGALLGVFLLGVMTKRTNETGAIAGMLIGLGFTFCLWRFSHVAFTWYVVFGSIVTFVTGLLVSRLAGRAANVNA